VLRQEDDEGRRTDVRLSRANPPTRSAHNQGMENLAEKIAELKKLEAEALAGAKADAAEAVAKIRGKRSSSSPFFVVKLSDLADGWSAETYVPEAQAKTVERALDRPTVAGMISAARETISSGRAKLDGHQVVLSKRTLGILAGSELGRCAAGEKPEGAGA